MSDIRHAAPPAATRPAAGPDPGPPRPEGTPPTGHGHAGNRQPDPLAAAFELTRAPVPWRRVWGTAVTTSLAYLVGLLAGHPQWSAWAFLGALSSLYVTDLPYRSRAGRLLCVAIGMGAAMGLGSLSTSWWLMASILAALSAAATLLAGRCRIPLPGGLLFILVACISAALPHPASEPARILFTLAGGGLAWIVGMSGWPLRPRAPEAGGIRSAYRALAAYLRDPTGERSLARQNHAATSVSEAIAAAAAGSRRDRAWAERAAYLAGRARELFLYAIALSAEDPRPPSAPWRRYVARLGDLIEPGSTLPAPPPAEGPGRHRLRFHEEVTRTVERLAAMPATAGHPAVAAGRWGGRAAERLPHSPLVAYGSLRIGIAVGLSVVLAHVLGAARPFWVPLTCAAVLQGETVFILTRRAVQRVVGTAAGLLLGGVLVAGLHVPAPVLMATIVALQALMVIFIARNYAIAVVFITAFALLILHLAGVAHPWQLMVARLRDTLLGVAVALGATYLLWPRVSSGRLPAAVSDLIGRAGALFERIGDTSVGAAAPRADRAELRSAILRADRLSHDALAELPPSKPALALAPCVAAAERLGYLLLAADACGQDLQADAVARAQVRHIFRALAAGAGGARPGTGRRRATPLRIPEIWPPVARELRALARCTESRPAPDEPDDGTAG